MVKLLCICDLCGKEIVTMNGFANIPFGEGYYTIDIHMDEHTVVKTEVCGECLGKIKNFMKGLMVKREDD